MGVNWGKELELSLTTHAWGNSAKQSENRCLLYLRAARSNGREEIINLGNSSHAFHPTRKALLLATSPWVFQSLNTWVCAVWEAPSVLTVTIHEERKTSLYIDEKRTFLACITETFMEADALPQLQAGSLTLQSGSAGARGSPGPAATRAGSANLPWGLLKMLQPLCLYP